MAGTATDALYRPGSDLLSRVLRRSTISAGAFHGRVRHGVGCLKLRKNHQVDKMHRCSVLTAHTTPYRALSLRTTRSKSSGPPCGLGHRICVREIRLRTATLARTATEAENILEAGVFPAAFAAPSSDQKSNESFRPAIDLSDPKGPQGQGPPRLVARPVRRISTRQGAIRSARTKQTMIFYGRQS